MKSQFDPSRVETAMQEELNKTEIKVLFYIQLVTMIDVRLD